MLSGLIGRVLYCAGALLLLLLLPQAALAQVTGAYFDSPAGDLIGGGQQYTLEADQLHEAVHYLGYAHQVEAIRIAFGNWGADFGMPVGVPFGPGDFEDAERFPFEGARSGGLAISAYGTGCNVLKGWFRIHEFQRVGSSVTVLAVDFLQSCEGVFPPLYGSIRINSSVPLHYPNPHARALNPLVATEGDTVTLDATRSFSRNAPVAGFQWTQLSGPPVVLDGADAATATFTAPSLSTGSSTLTFRVTVTDTDGNPGVLDVPVTVYDTTAGRTRAFLEAGPGNWIVSGGGPHEVSHSYDEANALIWQPDFGSPTPNYFGVFIDAAEQWTLRLDPRSGEDWQPGTYAGVQGSRRHGATRAGIDFEGDGRSCELVSGWLEMLEIERVDGQLNRLAVDFALSCNGGVPFFGAVRFNSAVPLDRNVLYAVAGPDVGSIEGQPLWLDGTQSFTRQPAALEYSWEQISGPPAEIADPHAAFTGIVPPAGGADMVFQLTVTDGSGRSDVDTVRVRVRGNDEPQSYLMVDSQAGDPVGSGQFWLLTSDDSIFLVDSPPNTELHADVNGVASWSLSMSPVGGAPSGSAHFTPGSYEFTAPEYNPDTPQPRFALNCFSYGVGRFDVLSITYSGDEIESAAVDFEQRCGMFAPPLFGKLRYNIVADTLPVARGSAAGDVVELKPFSLDGSTSSDDGAITAYSWTQVSGPTVELTGAQTATPSIAAAPRGPATLGFRLEVTDDDNNRGYATITIPVLLDPTDRDADGVRDNDDPFPDDPSESVDLDQDGVGDNADADDDDDGSPDATENLAPNGDRNQDGIPDSRQANVLTLTSATGRPVTIATSAGAVLASLAAVGNPNPAATPPGYSFDCGFFALTLDVAPGSSATVTLWVDDAANAVNYFKYNPAADSFYQFLYNGTTGAQILGDRIVLHFKDGLAGDSDGVANGHIVDPGGPAWPSRSVYGPAGGGGPMAPETLAALLVVLCWRLRRTTAG